MIDEIIKAATEKMQKTVGVLKSELSKIRTGRAHPSLLEQVMVSYYGNETPLSQVANINVEDGRTLAVTPWEKGMIQEVEKAIMSANLGLNPMSAGNVIRVPLPPLTEETRKDMVKLVKDETEKARVAVRNIRRDANSDFRDLLKSKEITEDDERASADQIQKLTDQYIKSLDAVCADKEKDLMEV